MTDDLLALEQRGWQALSGAAGEESAERFYDRVLANAVVMLLPGGMRLTDRDQILGSMSGAPWDAFELEDPQVLELGPDSAVVIYGVVAERDGSPYSALVSSTYVRRDDGWKLALHQQTPR